MPKLRAIENITSFKPILETNNQQVRDETIKLIEKTVLTFLRKLDSATKTTDVRKNKRQNSYLRNSFEIQSPASSSSERLLFSVGSLPTFSRQFRAMAQIYSLLLGNRRSTKRDLYYEYKKVYKNKQRNLDSAVSKICRFFHRPRQCLNVSGVEVNCEAYPVAIGAELMKFTGFNMDADTILVVEKDTVFQRLIDDGIFTMLPKVLLVTGRGFPDICTRSFLRWLLNQNPKKIFCLVDCDPYGLQIYCTYRYGGAKSEIESNGVKLYEIRMMGLKMSDAVKMNLDPIHRLTLTVADMKRLKKLKQLATTNDDSGLEKQVEAMIGAGYKVELEAMSSIKPDYILKDYIIPKLAPFTSVCL
ncbi:unnamed protein product [Bursaphelenchus xylophilus]|uniref:DNA topoisomerase (ATP-hydrolyzing) n=1 Tax=Bursaphelenchus xylophilus TaxID=6326 RepID=A0A7I8WQ65_BURXY|nr:unnamed protein product [Bursaphelenchus xylophilus]CAG9095777.1 unnamed protein product [Bursaphelenchus xylophilus]